MAEHVHVVPQNDSILHRVEDDGECVCGPRTEFVDGKDVTGWLVVHSSLDGRENVEKLADLIEKHTIASIERVAADVSEALHLPDMATELIANLRSYIRPCSEALAASLAAGESAEQFEQRLAALKIKEL